MAKNGNPFAIRKSPVGLITAQAVAFDDYMKNSIDDDRVHLCATSSTH